MADKATSVEEMKAETARRLAEAHMEIEPGLCCVHRVLADAAAEADPSEPVRLLEVNESTFPTEIMGLYFTPSRRAGSRCPSVVYDVTPGQYLDIAAGRLELPGDLRLGECVRKRRAAVAVEEAA